MRLSTFYRLMLTLPIFFLPLLLICPEVLSQQPSNKQKAVFRGRPEHQPGYVEKLVLTKANVKPNAVILISAKANKTVHFAADELKKYLDQITTSNGVIKSSKELLFNIEIIDQDKPFESVKSKVKIVLTSGSSFDPSFNQIISKEMLPSDESDSFIITTLDSETFPPDVNDTLLIAGGSERALLFGVYDFLERMGCRWFGPREEFVPQLKSLEVPPMNITESPILKWRVLELIAGGDAATVDWMAKIKLNGCWPEKYSPNKDMTVSQDSMKWAAVSNMIERGLTVFWGGHILPILFSPETYKDHPEYFAQIKGKRLDPSVAYQSRAQLCTSNPDVMRILCENTIKFLRNHHWVDTLIIWGNDTNVWCECDKCRTLEPDYERESPFGGLDRSATYCRMIKIVSEAVQHELPKRNIGFNHYYNLEDIPRDKAGNVLKTVLPDKSVLSCVDAYRQCDRHPFSDPNCPRGGKRIEPIAKMWAPYYEDSVSWSYYWSYNFQHGMPISMVHKIPDDFRFVKSLGINGVVDNVSLQPNSLKWYYNRLNFYIYGKASWNPDLDVNSVVSDFIEHYYGPAAEPMAKAWILLEQATTKFNLHPDFMTEDGSYRSVREIHGWMRDAGVRKLIPNRRVFDQLMQYFKEATELVAAKTNQPYRFRIALLKSKIAEWNPSKDIEIFGFLNYPSETFLYDIENDAITCHVIGGNNNGDCFWKKPLSVEQLVTIGDSAQVSVRINYGQQVVGESLYHRGPGLYLTHDPKAKFAADGHHSAMLRITEDKGKTAIASEIYIPSEGSRQQWSDFNIWKFGDDVTLRVDYVSDKDGYSYDFLYDVGGGFVSLGRFTFPLKLAFIAPMHSWGSLEYGLNVNFPLREWAVFKTFEVLKNSHKVN